MGFIENLDRRLNPDLYQLAEQQSEIAKRSAQKNIVVPPPAAATPVAGPKSPLAAPQAAPVVPYAAPPVFSASTVQVPVPQQVTSYNYAAPPVYSASTVQVPVPQQVTSYKDAAPPVYSARTIEVPALQAHVPQLAPPVVHYALPMPVQQPMVQPVVPQQVKISQPVQVQVVEKPVVQYVDKYVTVPPPSPRVEHHEEVVYVQGPGPYDQGGYAGYQHGGYMEYGAYAGYSAEYDTSGYAFAGAPAYPMPSSHGGFPGHEYGGYADYSTKYDTSGYAFAGAGQYPLQSPRPRTPRSFSDPNIPAPVRLPDAIQAGGYQAPARPPSTPRSRAEFGGGTFTPQSAKRGLPFGGQDQPYHVNW